MENDANKNVTTDMPSSPRSTRASARKRRVKNLEEEVAMVLSQDDDSDVEKVGIPKEDTVSVSTPTRKRRAAGEAPHTPRSTVIAAEHLQTPRRSVRKSIKPAQDYEDIIAKKTTRSAKKGENRTLLEEIDEGKSDNVEGPKWTPAKVGRVSQKRKARKKKNLEVKLTVANDPEIMVDGEVLDVIADDEDENKENVEPRDLNRNRKLPKDSDSKIVKRRSLETIQLTDSVKRNSQKLNVSDPGLSCLEIGSSSSGATIDTMIVNNDREVKNENSEPNEKLLNKKNLLPEIGNMSDLGLEPLELDESTIDIKQDSVKMSENAPTTDGTAETMSNEVVEDAQDLPANATFDTSDCIIISPECSKQSLENIDSKKMGLNVEKCQKDKEKDCIMPSLLISDDEESEVSEPAAKIPKLTVTTEENLSQTINNSSPITDRNEKTNRANTPQSRSKPYRFPTPYKNKDAKGVFKFNENDKLEDKPPVEIKLTTLEPKEIVLRSIRKRSLSACIDQSQNKQINRVTFHSPANQTAFIEELDVLIAKSTKKGNNPKNRKQSDNADDKSNITKRRKRSLSVDDSAMQSRLRVKTVPLTPNKGKVTPLKVQPRTKIPNFAAIHQRQFNQMENLVDHVARKAERAKVLTNSAHKIRIASAQKGAPPVKNVNKESSDGAGATVGQTMNVVKPKAVKKIELSEITLKQCSIESNTSDDENIAHNDCKLPNPRLIKIITTSQPKKTNQSAPPRKVFKPTQQTQSNAKPAFNLSTHVDTHQASTSLLFKPVHTTSSTADGFSRSLSDKVAERRQRHMDMFKGRARGRKDQENSGEIIRGVRSNRRFNLQMLHRKNLANQTD